MELTDLYEKTRKATEQDLIEALEAEAAKALEESVYQFNRTAMLQIYDRWLKDMVEPIHKQLTLILEKGQGAEHLAKYLRTATQTQRLRVIDLRDSFNDKQVRAAAAVNPAVMEISLFGPRTAGKIYRWDSSQLKHVISVHVDYAESQTLAKMQNGVIPPPFVLRQLLHKFTFQYFRSRMEMGLALFMRDVENNLQLTHRKVGSSLVGGPRTTVRRAEKWVKQNTHSDGDTVDGGAYDGVDISVDLATINPFAPEALDAAIHAIHSIKLNQGKYNQFTFPEVISRAGLERMADKGGFRWREKLMKRMKREKVSRSSSSNPSLWGANMSLKQSLNPYRSFTTGRDSFDKGTRPDMTPGGKEWLKDAFSRIEKMYRATNPKLWNSWTWGDLLDKVGIEDIPNGNVSLKLIKNMERHGMVGLQMDKTGKRIRHRLRFPKIGGEEIAMVNGEPLSRRVLLRFTPLSATLELWREGDQIMYSAEFGRENPEDLRLSVPITYGDGSSGNMIYSWHNVNPPEIEPSWEVSVDVQ